MKDVAVLKFGTNSLMNGRESLCEMVCESALDQIIEAYREGMRFVIVTSGARVAGIDILKSRGLDPSDFTPAQLAGIGAPRILKIWDTACWKHGIIISQMLLNYVNWRDFSERASIKTNILDTLDKGVITIINQNDLISGKLPQDEMALMLAGISDNDILASLVARLVGANRLLLCTDVEYVYERKPEIGMPLPRPYLEINAWDIPAHLREQTEDKGNGTGGVSSKVSAAADCAKAGIESVIAKLCVKERLIERFLRREPVGTLLGHNTRLG